MIELNQEDVQFKKSTERSENLMLVAVLLETIEHVRTKYGKYDQKSIISSLKSTLGDVDNSVKAREFSWWESPVKKSQYESKLASMVSEYVINRIAEFDREQKSNQEVAEWLREIAK